MASHDIYWVLGAHVRFGDLDFIITVGGELALAHAAIQPLSSIGLDFRRFERQLGVSLAPSAMSVGLAQRKKKTRHLRRTFFASGFSSFSHL